MQQHAKTTKAGRRGMNVLLLRGMKAGEYARGFDSDETPLVLL
jgi:hypothetical protein